MNEYERDLEKARIILHELDKKTVINWNMEDCYLDAICSGLRKVRVMETE